MASTQDICSTVTRPENRDQRLLATTRQHHNVVDGRALRDSECRDRSGLLEEALMRKDGNVVTAESEELMWTCRPNSPVNSCWPAAQIIKHAK